MYTELDICNLALARIGVDKTVMNLANEQSKEARLCRLFYPMARDETLEKVPWPFAQRVKALAPMTEADLIPGWGYAYAMPQDAAAITEVVSAGAVTEVASYYSDCCGPWMPYRGSRLAFRQAMSDDGTMPVILANIDDAYAVYTSRPTNTAGFSTMIVSLIADRLAMELAMPMTADPRWFQVAQQRYAAAFIDTASRQFEQEKYGPEGDAPSIRARN